MKISLWIREIHTHNWHEAYEVFGAYEWIAGPVLRDLCGGRVELSNDDTLFPRPNDKRCCWQKTTP